MGEYWVDANSAPARSVVVFARANTPEHLWGRLPDMLEAEVCRFASRATDPIRSAAAVARFIQDDWRKKVLPKWVHAQDDGEDQFQGGRGMDPSITPAFTADDIAAMGF
jgi:hypothetical protein